MRLIKHIPNCLTLLRILLIPIIVVTFYFPVPYNHWTTASIFAFASITDFLDGYLARRYQVTTNIGRFLDPIADKLIVAVCLMMLVHHNHINGASIIPALAILIREILVSGLREFLAGTQINVPVSHLAKFKTALQMIAIFLLLLGQEGPNIKVVPSFHDTILLGDSMLWLAAILTLITGYAYLQAGLKHMQAS